MDNGENLNGELNNQEEVDVMTLDEILEDKDYKAEYDKKIQGLRDKWQKEWTDKAENEKKEAERLGAMTAEERLQERIKQVEEKEQALNLIELKNQTKNILLGENLPTVFSDYIVTKGSKAEEINENIKELKKAYNEQLEEAIKKRLAGNTPKTSIGNGSKKEIPFQF